MNNKEKNELIDKMVDCAIKKRKKESKKILVRGAK